MIESGTPSNTQFSESKKSEKLASFMKALSSMLVGSIHDALFRLGSAWEPATPLAGCDGFTAPAYKFSFLSY